MFYSYLLLINFLSSSDKKLYNKFINKVIKAHVHNNITIIYRIFITCQSNSENFSCRNNGLFIITATTRFLRIFIFTNKTKTATLL